MKAFKAGNAGDLLNKYTSQTYMEDDFKKKPGDASLGLTGTNPNREERSELESKRAATKDLNSKINTQFKALPPPTKSTQASRFFKGYAQKKRDQIENDNSASNFTRSYSSAADTINHGMKPPAMATSFKPVSGTTFAKDGLAKKSMVSDNRDFMPAAFSDFTVTTKSFHKPHVPPKVANRVRPGTTKAVPKKPSPKRKSQYEEVFKSREFNADLEIGKLEKRRDETKQELKSLLTRYLSDF